MLVYDITNPMSFANLSNWKNTFLVKSEPKEPQTMPFLVLGNKCDVEDGLKKVSTVEASKFCEEGNFIFYETSAKDNMHIDEAFKALVIRVLER